MVLSEIEQSIKNKVEAIGKPLKEWDVKIYRGVLTGCNDAFIVSTAKRDEILSNCKTEEEREKTREIFRPILRGRDIKRYSYEWADLWLIATFPSRHYDVEQYPALKQYLLSFGMERLEQSGKEYIVDGHRIKARKKTSNKWFETQDSISYWDDFNQPKIVWGEISDRSKFALDSNGQFVPEATSFLMVGKHLEFLCCLLNSNIIEWYFSLIGTTTGVGTTRWKKYTLECIPAPLPEDDKHWQCLLNKLDTNLSGDSSIVEQINNDICHIFGLTEEECTYINDNC